MQPHKSKANILSILSILCTAIYPILFLYFKNVIEARERHLIVISLVYICISLITYIITFLINHKNVHKSAFISNLIIIFILNYEFIATLFTQALYMYIITALLMIIIVFFAGKLCSKINNDSLQKINLIWAITLLSLLLIDAVPAMPYVIMHITGRVPNESSSIHENDSPQNPTINSPLHSLNTSNLPNVYLMIFDEYGGPENLSYYYNFDNNEFNKWLLDRDFNISYTSQNVESISTVTNIPNLLNLSYVVEHETEGETYTSYIRNPYIYTLFSNMGYDINTSSYIDLLDNTHSTLHYDTKLLYEDTIGYYILKNSAFIHVYNNLIAPNMSSDQFATANHSGMYMIEALDYYKSFSSLSSDVPHLNLGYFMCPHIPYCYKSDGSEFTSKELESNSSENYLEYLQWTSSQIENIVQTILDNDPHSVIIIMSDHGSRNVVSDNDQSLDDPDYYKKNILNCVYIDGQALDIEGLTGINTLIQTLNTVFDYDIEYQKYAP